LTLAKKLKQWARGEAENRMIDLELLYLQNNCNPKLFELIKDKFVEKECPK